MKELLEQDDVGHEHGYGVWEIVNILDLHDWE
jgi:hypothetical protein